MTVREKQKLLDFWELARLEFPDEESQEGKLVGVLSWLELPKETVKAILGAKNYDEAKTIIWRL